MNRTEMIAIIDQYLSNDELDTQQTADHLNEQFNQAQNTYNQQLQQAQAEGAEYKGSPPPEQIISNPYQNFLNGNNESQGRGDISSALSTVFSNNLDEKKSMRFFSLLVSTEQDDNRKIGVLLPISLDPSHRPNNPNTQGASNGGYSNNLQRAKEASTYYNFANKFSKAASECLKLKNDDPKKAENIRILGDLISLLSKDRDDNNKHQVYVEVLNDMLEGGKAELARWMFEFIKQNHNDQLEAINGELIHFDEILSPISKCNDGVVLVLDVLTDFSDSTSRQKNLETALQSCDFYNQAKTPEKILNQSNPSSLSHLIEISGGLENQDNVNMLSSIENLLTQEPAIRSSFKCKSSLIWLLESFSENEFIRNKFERFIGDDVETLKTREQIKNLINVFKESDLKSELERKGIKPQIEAGKYFAHLHSEEYIDNWKNLSLSFQESKSSKEANKTALHVEDERGEEINANNFSSLSNELTKKIFNLTNTYQIDNSLLSEETRVSISTKIKNKLELMTPDLFVPKSRLLTSHPKNPDAKNVSNGQEKHNLGSQKS